MPRLFRNLTAWLGRAPVTDPLDRRNAPFVQVLLICFSCFVIVNKLLYVLAVSNRLWHRRSALLLDVTTDAVMCIAAWIAFWMIRRGKFRPAVTLFLGTVLTVMVVGYPMVDVKEVAFEAFPLLILALGGLVLGQRALWIIVSVQLLAYLGCLFSNLLNIEPHPEPALVAVGITFSVVGAYLLVAIVVDRAVAALRASLSEAIAKNERLEWEMAEKERAQEQLIHAKKMEAVGRMAGGMAHDFGNVLSVILGYTASRERLAISGGTPALLKVLDGVENAAARALLLCRKLLSFSRRDTAEPHRFDSVAVTRELLPMLRQLLGSDIRVQFTAEESSLPICLDRGQYELILLNLAANSRDAMPDTGRFEIVIRRVDEPPMVEVVVTDTGCGIDVEVLPHIFVPFYTTKPKEQGTGIGLSMVRDLLNAAGGSVVVESRPAQGATFRLRLPLANESSTEALAQACPAM